MKRASLGLALALVPTLASADIVHLKGGGRIEGIVRKTGDDVVVETLAGEVTVSAREVASIDMEHVSKLEEYYEKSREADAGDGPRAFVALAVWAKDNGARRFVGPNVARAAALMKKADDPNAVLALVELAREGGLDLGLAPLWERVIALDPENEAARRALGYRIHEGKWLTEEEFHAAQGNVRFRGEWMGREERDLRAKDLDLKLEARDRILRNREDLVGRKEKAVAEGTRKLATERRDLEKLKRELQSERARLDRERKDLEREKRNLDALRRRLNRGR